MSLIVSQDDNKEFEIVPPGVYTARCYQIIDLGTQETATQGGTKLQHKAYIYWEVLDDEVKMADGRPFAVSKQYTLSMFEGAFLYKDLVSWRGKNFTKEELEGFNIGNILGAYATIQIIHNSKNDRTYANVDTIIQYKGKDKPTAVNDTKLLELEIDTFDQEIYNGLSKYLQEKIAQSPEYQNIMANRTPKEDLKDVVIEGLDEAEQVDLDDIPF